MFTQQQLRSVRCGASLVEFAVVLPVVVLLMLGAVEVGRAVMVQHTLQEAAQAGCRVYSAYDTQLQDVQDIVAESMSQAGFSNYSITLDPPTKAEIDERMEPVTVSVSVNYQDVAWVTPVYFSGGSVTGNATMPADVEE